MGPRWPPPPLHSKPIDASLHKLAVDVFQDGIEVLRCQIGSEYPSAFPGSRSVDQQAVTQSHNSCHAAERVPCSRTWYKYRSNRMFPHLGRASAMLYLSTALSSRYQVWPSKCSSRRRVSEDRRLEAGYSVHRCDGFALPAGSRAGASSGRCRHHGQIPGDRHVSRLCAHQRLGRSLERNRSAGPVSIAD